MNVDDKMAGNAQPPAQIQGTYQHYKNGQRYRVLGAALQTETEETLVIYKPLYENEYDYFARPYDMFFGDVEHEGKTVKRFGKVSE